MSATYDTTTDNGIVRLLSTDTDITNAIFSDEEIAVFLSLNVVDGDNDLRLAAAQALRTIAASEVLIQKKIKLMDLHTDGPAEAAALMKLADKLEKESNEGGGITVTEWGLTDWNRREIIYNDALRNE